MLVFRNWTTETHCSRLIHLSSHTPVINPLNAGNKFRKCSIKLFEDCYGPEDSVRQKHIKDKEDDPLLLKNLPKPQTDTQTCTYTYLLEQHGSRQPKGGSSPFSADKCIKQTGKYSGILSSHKRKKVRIHAIRQKNPENNMLSERSQTQNVTYHMIPFIGNIQNR